MSTLPDTPGTAGTSAPMLAEDEVYVFPLSFAQQRLWVLDRLEPNSPAYNITVPLRLKGQLDVGALRESLAAILRRHEVLRSTFGEQDGEPIQIVPPPDSASLRFTDLCDLPFEQREEKAREITREDARTPFDLSRGPVFRAWLLKLDDQDHVLLLNVHHIVFDGWSHGILLQELLSYYDAFATGKTLSLPELPIQYADFAIWQRQHLSGERLAQQLDHWRHQLAGGPAGLDLPLDHPRPPLQTFRGAKYSILVSPALQRSLYQLSRQESATLFMTLLAAFNVLLARYSGQEDVVVGSPIAGRNRSEVEKLIGFFVNMLPLRTDLSGGPTFREVLSRVRNTCLGAYSHQELPFEKLLEELKPERDVSRSPIFQTMFALQNMPLEEGTRSAGLVVERFAASGSATTAKFELSLYAVEKAEGLRLLFEYNSDLFDRATIERMAGHFHALLEGIVEDADRVIADFPLLSKTERQRVLFEFNRTETDYRRDLCLHDLFHQQVERTPTALALVFGQEHLSYEELNRRSNQLARHLQNRRVGLESRVGIYVERSPEMLVAILGTLKAGAAYVPLDPAYPQDRIAFIAEDSRLELLLTQERLVEQLPAHSAQVVRLDADWPSISQESNEDSAVEVRPENLAYVLYTSGSTGKPKGVQIEHRNLVNFLSAMRTEPGLRADDVLLAVTTLSFDIAGLELFLPLTAGASIVLATREQATDGKQLARLVDRAGVTIMQATPSTWHVLLESGWTGTQNLKILCGGEALPRGLAEQLLPRCRELWNMYGPTETTIWSSVFRVTDTNWTTAPIGRPIANTQMYVLDKQRCPLPIGIAGELYIGGDGVARGYWNRPELTAEKFVVDPFRSQPQARMYATGDQVRMLADGNLQYLGRLDTQVKVRGYRIELGEVESVLAKHPAIQQTVAMVREDIPGDRRLVAYLTLKPGSAPSSNEWRSYLKQSLPEYMIPGDFVVLEEFPLTPNGKVDRKALPAFAATREAPAASVAKDELEAMLVTIWKRVLGVSSVGVTDNFFELGGHSLLAVRLMAEIQKVTGRDIPLATLFQGSTIEYLSEVIRQGGTPPHQRILPIQEAGSEPPFFGIVTPGMNALGYIALARNLGLEQPLYRIQGPGARIRGRSYSAREFEDLAADYIKDMKTIQPKGPYYLGGMCEGARIAFDMARLLEQENEEVALLAIFDTWVMENSQVRWLWRIDYYRSRIRGFRALSFERKRKFMKDWVQRRVKPKAALPAGTDWKTVYWPGKQFVPAKFGGKITVFKNPKQQFFYVRDPLLGWGTRTTVGVELQEVNTKHGFFMREPYVRDLAQKLFDCLHRARSQAAEMKSEPSDHESAATRLALSDESVLS